MKKLIPHAEFLALKTRLGLSGEALGRKLGLRTGRSVRKWLAGDATPPDAVLQLMRIWSLQMAPHPTDASNPSNPP